MRRFARIAALAAPFALAACLPPAPQPAPPPLGSSNPAPVAARTPMQAPPLAPTAFTNWIDAPATPGDWVYRRAERDSIADFRSPAGGQIFQMICTADRDLTLAVIARAPNARAITIRTEHGDRAISADAMENSVTAILAPTDPLLDMMAFSKGRFAVEVTGGPQLFLPAYPEVTRVIEDCRG